MCEFCTDPGPAKARAKRISEELIRLARDYEDMALGRIKMHTEQSAAVANKARPIIRELVEDWL